MKLFPFAHATHPNAEMATQLVLAQLRALMQQAQYAKSPNLGVLYITDHYVAQAQDILDHLSAELPWVADWTGTVGVGICANNVEYFDEPALAVMLCELPFDQFEVFSGVAPLSVSVQNGFEPNCALLHADGNTLDLSELIKEFAQDMQSGFVFGGLSSSRAQSIQFALSSRGNVSGQSTSRGVLLGGMSGVAFSDGVPMLTRVTQGCVPVSGEYEITRFDQHVILELNGRPALEVLLEVLGVTLLERQMALSKVKQTLVALVDVQEKGSAKTGHFQEQVMVRHIIGLDPARKAIAVAQILSPGMRLSFCERNAQAAKADLMRIATEVRASLEPEELSLEMAQSLTVGEFSEPHPARRILGAIYISCAGRGGPHFGSASAELQVLRRSLGDVPLVGFFAGGEIAHQNLYGYTGVLTVFIDDGRNG